MLCRRMGTQALRPGPPLQTGVRFPGDRGPGDAAAGCDAAHSRFSLLCPLQELSSGSPLKCGGPRHQGVGVIHFSMPGIFWKEI